MTTERKSRGRRKFLPLATVNEQRVPENISREVWFEDICQTFVCPSDANKSYYRVLLEELWPVGHDIPGPRVKEDELREAIDRFRKNQHLGDKPYKPYIDVL